MDVRVKKLSIEAKFKDLKAGDVFVLDYNGHVFMKTDGVSERYKRKKPNSVNLQDGHLTFFSDDSKVTPVCVETIVKDLKEGICMSNLKEQIKQVIEERLGYAYCDNCNRADRMIDLCDECHRKYISWSASESVIEEVADEIIKKAEGGNSDWHDLRKDPNDLPKEEAWCVTYSENSFSFESEDYRDYEVCLYSKGLFIPKGIKGVSKNSVVAWHYGPFKGGEIWK